MHSNIPVLISGHVLIEDDLGNVLLDKENAVHPQNMSRIIARALSNESNFRINRIAYGNGGTNIDAAFNITFNPPNDGQPPDVQTWESRLYNETYSEIVDDSNTALLGTDPGSAGPSVGTRPGGGANPSGDPASITHVSGPGTRSRELGLTSEVLIVSVLNPSEPTGQFANDQTLSNINSPFTFDELALFTTGQQAAASSGSQDIDVGNKTSTDLTNLVMGTTYTFQIAVDAATSAPISYTTVSLTPPTATTTFGELCEALNNITGATGIAWGVSTPLPSLTTCSITDTTFGTYPSIEGLQTFGFLRFTSGTAGNTSKIRVIGDGSPTDLFVGLAGTVVTPAADGNDKGVQNNATNPSTEQERMLTHLIFAPIIKAANRTLTITYTLTVAVGRTQT